MPHNRGAPHPRQPRTVAASDPRAANAAQVQATLGGTQTPDAVAARVAASEADLAARAIPAGTQFQQQPFVGLQGTAGEAGRQLGRGSLGRLQGLGLDVATAGLTDRQLDQTQLQEARGLGLQTRGFQGGNIAALNAAALGQVPSAAELQGQQQLEQAQLQQFALANSARGGPGAQIAAQRGAAQGIAGLQAQAVGGAAQLRAQEQAEARAQLTGALGQARGQDLQLGQLDLAAAGQNLGAQQQADELLLRRQLGGISALQGVESLGLQAFSQQQAQQQALEQQRRAQEQARLQLLLSGEIGASAASAARPDIGQQLLGAGLQVGGTVLGGVLAGPAGAVGGAAAGSAAAEAI